MFFPDLQWIGLTELPQSGTTFIATALTASPQVAYLHEPFNPSCGIVGIDWNCVDLIDGDLAPRGPVPDVVSRILRLWGRLRKRAAATDSAPRKAMKRELGGRGPIELTKARLSKPWITHGVLKDLIGFYLLPYLQQRFGFQNAVVVKHPIAAYAGLNRVGWHSGLEFLRERQYLHPHMTQEELRLLHGLATTPVEIVATQWRITYGLLTRWARKRNWKIVVIEELSENPVYELTQLALHLGLPWDRKSESKVKKLTNPLNSAAAKPGRVQALSRDSRKVFQSQIARVDRAERRIIFEKTSDLACEFYRESTFELD